MESWRQTYTARLDELGELVPPWQKFPHLSRHSVAWRLGAAEEHLVMWLLFQERLGKERFQYLRRQARAPFTWADQVWKILEPGAPEKLEQLVEWQLVESDVAYTNWRAAFHQPVWIWERTVLDPREAARYLTREFAFQSRRLGEMDRPPALPQGWHGPEPYAGDGLLFLAHQLCAGRVAPPWSIGLQPSDFTGSIDERDMSYSDAFRHWCREYFDDLPQWRRYLQPHPPTSTWREWIDEHIADHLAG